MYLLLNIYQYSQDGSRVDVIDNEGYKLYIQFSVKVCLNVQIRSIDRENLFSFYDNIPSYVSAFGSKLFIQ